MNVLEILNTIRDNATTEYQERIPEATRTNIEEIGALMLDGDNVQVANEFMNTLLNKLVKSVVHTKRFENPLKTLKKGKKPVGDTIEEIYHNFIKGVKPDAISSDLLQRHLPDTKTVYHRKNYENQYPITVDRKRLAKAFMSIDALDSYITGLINTLYNSAELDEFANTKQLIATAIKKGAIKTVDIADPLASESNAKEFIKTVKGVSGMMCFPSKDWNGYLTAQSKDTKAITTFSRKNEQVLIIDTMTDVSVAVDVLASAFNMSVADFNDTAKIVIDAFPTSTKGSIRAMLCDKEFFQIFDDFYAITEFFNGKGVYTNYYLNVDQTFAYSPLVNAVAFVVPTA